MRLTLLTICFLCASLWSNDPSYASKQPLTEPAIFASGMISTADFDSHPAFTPDGKTLYFLRSSPTFNFWTIYFVSDRPKDASSASGIGRSLDIWFMDRSGNGWALPQNVGEPVNSAGNEWYPTVARDGTIYFG